MSNCNGSSFRPPTDLCLNNLVVDDVAVIRCQAVARNLRVQETLSFNGGAPGDVLVNQGGGDAAWEPYPSEEIFYDVTLERSVGSGIIAEERVFNLERLNLIGASNVIQNVSKSGGTTTVEFAPTPIGPQGATGPQGVMGFQGLTGAQGPQGVPGPQGLMGFQGVLGAQGAQGSSGPQGLVGFQGIPGAQGVQGLSGPQGLAGFQGPLGAQGVAGPQGLMGFQGLLGAQGAQGAQGTQGAAGPQGLMGFQGLLGAQGVAGLQGSIGVQGALGPQGATGPQGAQGDGADVTLANASGVTLVNDGTGPALQIKGLVAGTGIDLVNNATNVAIGLSNIVFGQLRTTTTNVDPAGNVGTNRILVYPAYEQIGSGATPSISTTLAAANDMDGPANGQLRVLAAASVTGFVTYQVCAFIGSLDWGCRVVRNGTPISQSYAFNESIGNNAITNSFIIDLNQNDVFQVEWSKVGGSDATININSFSFSIHQIRAF